MEINSTIIDAVIGVGGTGFAALLAAVGYLYKTRQETRKSVRKVLYYLLEIRAALSCFRLDADAAADQYIALADQRLTSKWKAPPGSIPAEIRIAIASHFQNLFMALRPEIDSGLIDRYHSSLLELAQSHPILAFKLRGKEKLKDGLTATEQYYEDTAKRVIADISDKQVSSSMSTLGGAFKGQVLDEIIESLNTEILQVAWASGLVDFFRCYLIIRKSTGVVELDFSSVDETVDELVNSLVQSVSTSASAQKTALQ